MTETRHSGRGPKSAADETPRCPGRHVKGLILIHTSPGANARLSQPHPLHGNTCHERHLDVPIPVAIGVPRVGARLRLCMRRQSRSLHRPPLQSRLSRVALPRPLRRSAEERDAHGCGACTSPVAALQGGWCASANGTTRYVRHGLVRCNATRGNDALALQCASACRTVLQRGAAA